jgi:hypothetical protein
VRFVPMRVVTATTDMARDLLPFVQTGVKGLDELRDRGAARLRRHRSARRRRTQPLTLVSRGGRIPV